MIASWQAPLSNRKSSEELLLSFDQQRDRRILILPALFDEANKMRRFTVQVMRKLDALGIDSFLPDLPGCNESLVSLDRQTLPSWRNAAQAAAEYVNATHVLAIRGGALLAPNSLPGWYYAPQTGPKMLKGMLRARIISAREDGHEETSELLLELGRREGLVLAGWPIGAQMLRELETTEASPLEIFTTIAQDTLGGPGLWLRAEPGEDDTQTAALAKIIADDTGKAG